MSIVNEKPQLDPVLALPGATGQEFKQKERHNDALKILSCFKEFETVNFETRNPEMNFPIQSSVYSVISKTSTLTGNVCRVEESGLTFLQTAETACLNFNRLFESYSIVTGRASEFLSCQEAPENKN
ncbi:hypothetical protein RSJ42_07070 [Methanosarcina hadiensis]|uniref:hypothetical protein n=1 Tax=Methanosarcina hadiensis TaxID=3078083 RepID=UPI003977B0C0